MASCKGCARNKDNTHDPDNPICVACKRRPYTQRPDNYITLEAYQNFVLKGLFGR